MAYRYRTPLKYDYSVYVPNYEAIIDQISDKDARREYTRLRDIAEKRLKRLESSEWNQSAAYLENREGFMKLRDITTNRMFAREFASLARFVNAPTSTIQGQREARRKAISSLNASGIPITAEHWNEFEQFIDAFKDYLAAGIFSSREALEDVAEQLNESIGIDDILDRYYQYIKGVLPDDSQWESLSTAEKTALVARIQLP